MKHVIIILEQNWPTPTPLPFSCCFLSLMFSLHFPSLSFCFFKTFLSGFLPLHFFLSFFPKIRIFTTPLPANFLLKLFSCLFENHPLPLFPMHYFLLKLFKISFNFPCSTLRAATRIFWVCDGLSNKIKKRMGPMHPKWCIQGGYAW